MSCSSSILFCLPARSLVQSTSEHQEYPKFIHSLGFCCVQSLLSQVNGIWKCWHRRQTSNALCWLEPNPDLYRGVKTHSHVGLAFLPQAALLTGAGQHHTEVLRHEPSPWNFQFCQKQERLEISWDWLFLGGFHPRFLMRVAQISICQALPAFWGPRRCLLSTHGAALRPQSSSKCKGCRKYLQHASAQSPCLCGNGLRLSFVTQTLGLSVLRTHSISRWRVFIFL